MRVRCVILLLLLEASYLCLFLSCLFKAGGAHGYFLNIRRTKGIRVHKATGSRIAGIDEEPVLEAETDRDRDRERDIDV